MPSSSVTFLPCHLSDTARSQSQEERKGNSPRPSANRGRLPAPPRGGCSMVRVFPLVSGVVLLLAGCSHRPAAPPSFAAQVAAVRAGTSRVVVSGEQVTDQQFAQLQGLSQVEQLELTSAPLTDAIAGDLATLRGLRRLRLEPAELGDLAADAIGTLPLLETLNLPQARISDEGLRSWVRLPNLILLRIGGSRFTDQALATIGAMKHLRFLHLLNARLTETGLGHLHQMHQLESFYVDGCEATDDGWSKLLRALPELHFHRDQQHLPNDPRADDHG